jgi:hypothetical protein
MRNKYKTESEELFNYLQEVLPGDWKVIENSSNKISSVLTEAGVNIPHSKMGGSYAIYFYDFAYFVLGKYDRFQVFIVRDKERSENKYKYNLFILYYDELDPIFTHKSKDYKECVDFLFVFSIRARTFFGEILKNSHKKDMNEIINSPNEKAERNFSFLEIKE